MSAVMHGACLCGGITFDLGGAEVMGACHCTRCQRWTGSANTMVIVAKPEGLKITKGKELLKKFHEDGFADRYFCGNCGSGIYVTGSDKIYVGAGVIKDVGMAPAFHIQVAYKAPWDQIAGSAPQFPEWPPS